MKKVLTTSAALLLTTTVASAGGLDRSGQSVGIIFEDGNVAELSFGSVQPDVSGTGFSGASGNIAENYVQFSGGIKYDVRPNLSFSVIFDQPFGADVSYDEAAGTYYTGPATAKVDSSAITAIARYRIDGNFAVHGGVRYQTVSASVSKPTIPGGGYTIESEDSSAVGFVGGVSYERPEIALRVALTYNSAIEHDITATETCVVPACTTATTSVKTPESINLDFQTGVAADTLVFGSVRYAKWTQFDFAPPGHAGLGLGSLQSYEEDTVAYTVGVGRRFNDMWSGAISIGYEGTQGGFAGDLAPTDGNMSLGVGATYTGDGFKVTGGVRYIMLGDADTENPLAPGTTGTAFTDNSAIAAGVKVTYSF